MIPIIGVVGESKSGKTTLIIKLIQELRKRGYQVAAIKHTRHQVSMDHPGKDSALLYEAGAIAVSLATPTQLSLRLQTPEPWTAEDIVAKLFPQVDLVLVEGMREEPIPKIAIFNSAPSAQLLNLKGIFATVSEAEIHTDQPRFRPDQVKEIADLVEDYIRRLGKKREVKLYVNEKKLFLKPFIKDLILKTVSGMLSSLKGTAAAKSFQVLIHQPKGEAPEEE